jgi:hypothetical protein
VAGLTAGPSITREVSLTQNNRHYVRHASRNRLRVGSILGRKELGKQRSDHAQRLGLVRGPVREIRLIGRVRRLPGLVTAVQIGLIRLAG